MINSINFTKKSLNDFTSTFFLKYYKNNINSDRISMKYNIVINDKFRIIFKHQEIYTDLLVILSSIDSHTKFNFFKFYKVYLFKIYNEFIIIDTDDDNKTIHNLINKFHEHDDFFDLFILSFFYYF